MLAAQMQGGGLISFLPTGARLVTLIWHERAPIVGAGLPGLIFASVGLLGWWRRRQRTA